MIQLKVYSKFTMSKLPYNTYKTQLYTVSLVFSRVLWHFHAHFSACNYTFVMMIDLCIALCLFRGKMINYIIQNVDDLISILFNFYKELCFWLQAFGEGLKTQNGAWKKSRDQMDQKEKSQNAGLDVPLCCTVATRTYFCVHWSRPKS